MSGLSAKVDLVPRPLSARAGRRFVEAVLTSWAVPSWAVDDVVLMVSELVSNAVKHVRRETVLHLEIARRDSSLRLSLSDGSVVRPLARDAARDDESGRGMAIITALSNRWGIEDHEDGKQIWFEVDLVRAAPTAAEAAADMRWDVLDMEVPEGRTGERRRRAEGNGHRKASH